MTNGGAQAKPAVDHFRLVGTFLEQKYQVESVVAEGGFGVVYRGTHAVLGRPVAVKVLKVPAELNERARGEFRRRFELEARTIARLAHPNIVQAFDFGVAEMPNGEVSPWMVLEWVDGRTLEEILTPRRGHGGQSPRAVLDLLRPVLQALAYAHDLGIAHRDIKPANIIVAETRRSALPRLMDFGIAKVMEEGETTESGETRTQSAVRAFSLRYAAPEQLSGTRTGPWTDVHAVALLVMEMLLDAPPYRSRDKGALYTEILSPTRATPRRVGCDAGPWEDVLARALALNPVERFQHAADFLAALEANVPAALFPITHGSATGTTAMHGTGGWPRMPDPPTAPIGPGLGISALTGNTGNTGNVPGGAGHVPGNTGNFTGNTGNVTGSPLAVPTPARPRGAALPWIAVGVSSVIALAIAGAGLSRRGSPPRAPAPAVLQPPAPTIAAAPTIAPTNATANPNPNPNAPPPATRPEGADDAPPPAVQPAEPTGAERGTASAEAPADDSDPPDAAARTRTRAPARTAAAPQTTAPRPARNQGSRRRRGDDIDIE